MSLVTTDANPFAAIRSLIHRQAADGATLPVEGRLPGFEGATGWLNSEPLTPAGLRGRVVLVNFWTYTCINWLRTLPYVRAWATKYRDQGLTVIGVHTPEFGFEHDRDNVISVSQDENVDYPIALDNDYAVWRAFANNFWPAIYIADAEGRIRYHHFGEREYAMTEMVIQQLLMDAGARGHRRRAGERATAGLRGRCATGRPFGHRRPTSATAGPPASHHPTTSGPMRPTPTRSLPGFGSIGGRQSGIGRSRSTPRC